MELQNSRILAEDGLWHSLFPFLVPVGDEELVDLV
jgi:hypothetical protein